MEIRFQRIFLTVFVYLAMSTISVATYADHNVLIDDISVSPNINYYLAEQSSGENIDGITKFNVVKADVERREVLDELLDSENFEVGVQLGFISIEDFESNLWVSGHLAYHINEYFYAKAVYGTATAGESSFEKLANVPPLLTDEQRKFNYYGLNFGYNLMPGEIFLSKDLAFNSVFSIELGGGSTEFAGDDKFTVNLVANFRVFINDWITWDIAMSDYVLNTNITGSDKTTHNLNFTTGFSFYF